MLRGKGAREQIIRKSLSNIPRQRDRAHLALTAGYKAGFVAGGAGFLRSGVMATVDGRGVFMGWR
jgi:hypothetical protein